MNKPFPGLGTALIILGLALGAQAGTAFLILQAGGQSFDLTLLAGIANLIALSTVVVLGFWRSGEAPRWSSVPKRAKRGAGLWAGILLTATGGTLVLGELADLTAWVVPLPPELARLFNQLTNGPVAVSLFTLAFVAPLTEEALFRGLLLRGFARRYGPWAGIVLSSALFALFHLNVWQALAAFAAGLYLGRLFLATGSLLYPMAAHALFNGLPVALAALGFLVTGYNTPTPDGLPELIPLPWVAVGALLTGVGLWLSMRWAPLSPRTVSDTVGP